MSKYEVFHKVVEVGNLTKAAEAMRLTQSAVSYSIANWENELGFRLLNRNRSGITLTSNGERMLTHVRAILTIEEKLRQEAQLIKGVDIGEVRIGAFTSVCIQWLPALMKIFKEQYPSVTIKILQGSYQQIEEWILQGMVDFGFTTLPSVENVETISLKQDQLLCILPLQHRFSQQSKIDINQLENEPFILNGDIKRLLSTTTIEPKNSFEITDDRAIAAMVENELGISVMPELVLQGLPNKLCTVMLEPAQHRNIGIAALSFDNLSPAAKKFFLLTKGKILRQ